MKDELKRRRILKALQKECMGLLSLTNKLERDLLTKKGKSR